jgi:hypothetical protein
MFGSKFIVLHRWEIRRIEKQVKNRPDDAIYADVQHFLLRQFDFIYKLIHKNTYTG